MSELNFSHIVCMFPNGADRKVGYSLTVIQIDFQEQGTGYGKCSDRSVRQRQKATEFDTT